MKKTYFLFFALLSIALTATFTSCSSEANSASITIPVDAIFRSISQNERTANILTSDCTLKISINGDNSFKNEISIPWDTETPTAGQTFNNIPIGITLSATAQIIESEHVIFSGTSDTITTAEGENTISIAMKQLLSSVVVKTESTEISDCNIKLTVTSDESCEYTCTGEELKSGYEIKYLPVDGKITVSAEATLNETAIYRGSAESTVTKEKQTIALTMNEITSGGSVSIKQLPQDIYIETAFTDTTDTISLTATTANFKISYGDERKILPDWVTYIWELNGNAFETDGTIAKFDKTTGELSIDLTKINGLVSGTNQIVVEISCEGSSEVTAGSVNFTVTE